MKIKIIIIWTLTSLLSGMIFSLAFEVRDINRIIENIETRIQTISQINSSIMEQLAIKSIDLDKVPSMVMECTAYNADECGKTKDDPWYRITASLTEVKEGQTVAMGKAFPFGTVIFIEGVGIRVCEDRGGAIKNDCVDIFMEDLDRVNEFGRVKLKVWILSIPKGGNK